MKLNLLLLVFLVATIVVIYFSHVLVIKSLTSCLVGPTTIGERRGFLTAITRRVWGYVLLPLFFSYFGIGLSLLPSPQIQALASIEFDHQPQEMPYSSQAITGLDSGALRIKLIISMAATMVIVSVLRMLIAKYHPQLVRLLIYVFLSCSGLALFTALANPNYYHVLFDSVLRLELSWSIVIIPLAGALTCIVTEYLLHSFPYDGGY
jgi:hypothetical protein